MNFEIQTYNLIFRLKTFTKVYDNTRTSINYNELNHVMADIYNVNELS